MKKGMLLNEMKVRNIANVLLSRSSVINKTLVLFVLSLVFSISASADVVTVNVETAGTLATKIADADKYVITDLKVTGSLNGTDIRFLREMMGRDVDNKKTDGKLTSLDLSEARIVSGGDYYTSNNYCTTDDDVIGNYMFSSMDNVKTVILPKTTIKIGTNAFDGCTVLGDVTIPDGVTSIEDYAFQGCGGITKVELPSKLTNLGLGVYSTCPNLKTAVLPKSITNVNGFVFYQCDNLVSVELGDSVDSIGMYTFAYCGKLKNISIPTKVKYIGEAAFSSCKSIKSLNMPSPLTEISSALFCYCDSLQGVTIPDGVTTIGGSAFAGCPAITTINVPSSVQSIGDYAFYGCTALTSIMAIPNVPPTCGEECFTDVDQSKCIIWVTKGNIDTYKQADTWKDFTNIYEIGHGPSDGINSTNTNESKEVARYNAEGKLLTVPTKGLNIIKMSDGTVKKIVNK
jgi:hypothetical protein